MEGIIIDGRVYVPEHGTVDCSRCALESDEIDCQGCCSVYNCNAILIYSEELTQRLNKEAKVIVDPKLIPRVLSQFDFGKVHDYMATVGRKWGLGGDAHIPSYSELYQKAEELLYDAAQKGCDAFCGGFWASPHRDGSGIGLSFILTYSEAWLTESEKKDSDGKQQLEGSEV